MWGRIWLYSLWGGVIFGYCVVYFDEDSLLWSLVVEGENIMYVELKSF